MFVIHFASVFQADAQSKIPDETWQLSCADSVPAIEDMASEWLDVAQITHMPSLHNFHEMAVCAPDLLKVNYFPGRRLFVYPVTTRWFDYHTLPFVNLRINGDSLESTTCRWYPYQAVRRRTIGKFQVETTVRLVFEGPGILYRIQITNTSPETSSVHVDLEAPGDKVNSPGGLSTLTRSEDPALWMVHSFVQQPEKQKVAPAGIVASWSPTLGPGKSLSLELVMAHSLEKTSTSAENVLHTAQKWAHDFDRIWNSTKNGWARRWLDVFTPGNPHFSGSLPVLVTPDKKISDIYYRSLLTLLVLHRTNLRMCDRVFITSGEREKGNVFYWDTSMWSKVFALLEPRGMKEQLRLFLQADPHGGFVYNMDTGKQGDGWYAANDMAMFRMVNSYLAVTGDTSFLHERIGDRSVLGHLEKLALGWQGLQRDKSVMLADYGENKNLLECAPMYVHRVASFNAANVWMMRTMANLWYQQGNAARAKQLQQWANQISAAVLGLYKPEDGVWYALHRNGERVELRHCYDFVCVGKFMADDLPRKVKLEMVGFVERELLTDKWMRAMSLRDKAAAISDRPDHGPMGAYDAWPALTADTMCELGAWRQAVAFLRRTQAALYEGVYAQAREFYGPHRLEYNAPVRIALRGACMRECVGGGAFAEMILSELFGFDPEYEKKLPLRAHEVDRGFTGKLINIHCQDEWLDIVSNSSGVHLHRNQ